jgi:hypothetical protein
MHFLLLTSGWRYRFWFLLLLALAGGPAFSADTPSVDVVVDREIVHYPSGGRDLIGFLYKPAGNGPFPVHLWNHGSEREPKTGAALAKFWVPQGFVFSRRSAADMAAIQGNGLWISRNACEIRIRGRGFTSC